MCKPISIKSTMYSQPQKFTRHRILKNAQFPRNLCMQSSKFQSIVAFATHTVIYWIKSVAPSQIRNLHLSWNLRPWTCVANCTRVLQTALLPCQRQVSAKTDTRTSFSNVHQFDVNKRQCTITQPRDHLAVPPKVQRTTMTSTKIPPTTEFNYT